MIEAYLEQGDVKIQLPLPPTSLPLHTSADNKTLNLLNYGEVTSIGIPKQFTLTYNSLFPTSAVSVRIKNVKPPSYYVNAIRKMMYNTAPVYFSITGTSLGAFRVKVSIESFNPTQRAGTSRVVDYQLTMKEYRTVTSRYLQTVELPPLPYIATPTVKDSTEENNKSQSDIMNTAPNTPIKKEQSHMEKLESMGMTSTSHYTVMKGDTFVEIVKKNYGSTEFVVPVMNFNRHILNFGNLTPGTIVNLPPPSKLSSPPPLGRVIK